MASGKFLDPIVALQVAPLISSTCTLFFAWDQHFFLSIFNQTDIRKESTSKPLLRSYFSAFFYRATFSVVTCLAATTVTTLTTLITQKPHLVAKNRVGWWYVAGAAFSLGHLLFVPVIAPSCRAIMDAKEGDDVNESLDEWLFINKLRMLTVDVAAWMSFAVAVAKTLRS